MRMFLSAAVAVLGLCLGGSYQAEARTQWTCTGPAYVCGTPKLTKWNAPASKSYKKSKAYKAKSAKKYKTYKKVKKTYTSKSYSGSNYSGIASYYWQPQRVASGGWFNPNAMTAAHKTLPFGTRVRVTNRRNGRSVVVRINDRGPYIKGRIIDLSRAAAGKIGMRKSGIAPVTVTVLGKG